MNRDLFLAILAMDAYNRGYGQGINGLNPFGQLGTASIKNDSFILGGTVTDRIDVRSGFYAIAYDVSGVEGLSGTVISYRGTDKLGSFPWTPEGSDVVNGWPLGGGYYMADQAQLAAQFYNKVIGPETSLIGSGTTLTGHSLGGGLAGFIGSIYGLSFALFDNMTFELSAQRLFENKEDSAVRDAYFRGGEVVTADAGKQSAFATTGEFLYANRIGQNLPVTSLNSHGGLRSPVELHSMALHVMLQYAEGLDDVSWHKAAEELWNAAFDDDVARAVPGLEDILGRYDAADALKTIIAYSALDEGERPFGDTGIHAMFDDANDLGRVIEGGEPAGFDIRLEFAPSVGLGGISLGKTIRQFLADVAVQYAAALALYDVEQSSDGGVKEGILEHDEPNNVFVFDATLDSWEEALGNAVEPVNFAQFQQAYFSQGGEGVLAPLRKFFGFGKVGPDELAKLAGFHYGVSDARAFQRYFFALGGGDVTLTDGPTNGGSGEEGGDTAARSSRRDFIATSDDALQSGDSSGGGRLPIINSFVGDGGGDTVTGSDGHDFIATGDGDDTIDGGDGDDILVGGDGDDTLQGGGGRNLLFGGDGDGDGLRYDNGVGPLYLVIAPDLADEGAGFFDDLKVQARITSDGGAFSDTLFEMEDVFLGTAADHLTVSKEGFGLFAGTLTLDMGSTEGGDEASYDTLSFAPRDGLLWGQNGVFWHNGTLQSASPVFAPLYYASYFGGPASTGFLDKVFAVEDALTPDDPLVVRGIENVELTDFDDRFAFTDRNYSVHSGFGKIEGRGGDDILLFYGAKDEGSLALDGGTGNDWISASGGDNAVTIGGLGRDWIYNTSDGGVIWGDIANSTLRADGDREIVIDGEKIIIKDAPENSDNIWYAPNVKVMDAQKHDVLKFYGLPLTGGDANGGLLAATVGGSMGSVIGGTNFAFSKGDWRGQVYMDHLLPWMTYKFAEDEDGNLDLFITNQFDQLFLAIFGGETSEEYERQKALASEGILKGWMKIENVDVPLSYFGLQQLGLVNEGTLNMAFRAANPIWAILELLPPMLMMEAATGGGKLVDQAFSALGAMQRFVKALGWSVEADPLVIDLDGDGLETTSMGLGQAYFDLDGDMFAERTGWLKGDDGFLVIDINGNGRIDDIDEMFGGVGQSGFAELAGLDSDGDGKITVADVVWSELKIWQDFNRDGVTDSGELKTLDAMGIVSLDTMAQSLDATTPQGARLTGYGDVLFANGVRRTMFDAILNANEVDTKYAGEGGKADWQASQTLDAKGFGRITDLSVAMANDVALEELATTAAAAMTTPKLRTLVAQAGEVLGQWGAGQELTRELAPVLVGVDENGVAVLVDRGVYVEDAQGGYWSLASGADVVDAQGASIARPTLEDVLAQAGGWRLEQQWSPSDRGSALEHREPAPYLTQIVDGRAVILDYGIEQQDGTWRLASDPDTVYATRADILALTHADGTEWRTEELGFNPLANIPVDRIGVRFTDGEVVDYTVQVTDRDGTFYVWARNLDRAIELEWKTGDSREFNLRNYAIDFDTLDEVNSADDATYRVEMLTPEQFHFATSLGGIDFQPAMLSATLDSDTGHIDYAVGPTGEANLSTDPDRYVSGIKVMIELLEPVMVQYITASRRFAVRLALQGGLSAYADGFEYDAATDSYIPTTKRQLAPLFEAIFADAPPSNENDAVLDYLTAWNEILWQIYPDYRPSGEGNLLGGAVSIDQAFIMQMLLPAFENTGIDLDIRGVAHALSINETRIIDHAADAAEVNGTSGTDFFYLSTGDQQISGGDGADFYFVGKDAGNDVIFDQDDGDADELRFTDVMSDQVKAIRDGEDLILEIEGRPSVIRLTDQFLGELNPYLTNAKQLESGVTAIVFADGVVWDRFRMAMEVVDKERAEGVFNDSLLGSGSGDVLWGGKGNDYMSGGVGGDFYIFGRGDGEDVIDDLGAYSFGPVEAGIDFLRFQGDITADDLRLIRDGESDDLRIIVLDKDGNESGDTIVIVGQFGGVATNLELYSEIIGSETGLDYVAPNLIERFIFEDGTSLEFTQILERVLENAKTDGDDAIFGMLNNNTLDGGAGDDLLVGREGDDTYIFGRGYGSDVVRDGDVSIKFFAGQQRDTLKFVDDIRWTDLEFLREGMSDTLSLRVTGTQDTVILEEFLKYDWLFGYHNLLEDIEFGDGTRWSHLQLLQHFVDAKRTDGDDIIYGFGGISDVLDGGAGNDRLEGLGGGDTYHFGVGSGNDTIRGSAGDRVIFANLASDDVVFSRTALDLVITIEATGERLVLENQYGREGQQVNAVDKLQFTDRTVVFTEVNPEDLDLVGTSGNDVITGSNFSETLDGRAGNDTLIGGDGGDVYRFDVGYGQDVIIDRRIRASWEDRRGVSVPVTDIVQLGGSIARDDLVFTKDGNDLLLSVIGRTDTLRIRDQFGDSDSGVERFEFWDGTAISISDVEDLLQIAGGNRGDNILDGLPDQPNVLDGRQGNDVLIGGNHADTYVFSAGYGFDRIEEQPDAHQDNPLDSVVFGASVRKEDVRITRSGDDLVIDLGNRTDVLTIANGLTSTKVERFRFGDGTEWTIDQIVDLMLHGTDEDEQIAGFSNRDDTISGGGGNDLLAGSSGNDTYLFGYGDGQDRIEDSHGVDRLVFGATIIRDDLEFLDIDGTLLVRLKRSGESIAIVRSPEGYGIENFAFEDGTTLNIAEIDIAIANARPGGAQANILSPVAPGGGHDAVTLVSGDTVVFRRGDGMDTITRVNKPGVTAQPGAIIDLPDYLPSQTVVRLAQIDSTDWIIDFPETGDQIRLVGSPVLPSVQFANGTIWDESDFSRHAVAARGNDADNVIFGSQFGDEIAGGRGNDDISGGGGNDTVIFRRGDGRDVIQDASGADTLKIFGYRPDELHVRRPLVDRNELLLTFAFSDDEIFLRYDAGLNGIDRVEFSDGTVFTRDALFSQTIGDGSDFDDLLEGTSGDEIFTGGRGDDVIAGGAGSDRYVFRRGDGFDTIDEAGVKGDINTLVLLDHRPADVLARLLPGSDVDVVINLGGGDGIVLEDALADRFDHNYSDTRTSYPYGKVNRIEFADGTIWNTAALRGAVERGMTASTATVTGTSGDDTIAGTPLDEILTGGTGRDRYEYQRGGGRDTIVATSKANEVKFLAISGYNIADATFAVAPEDEYSLVIRFKGTEDEIFVKDAFRSIGSTGSAPNVTHFVPIERFQFDDGELVSREIAALIGSGQASDGNDHITGTPFDDVITPGLGDDIIELNGGEDQLVFRRGDGKDRYVEPSWGTLRLVGYTPDEVVFNRVPGDDGFFLTFTSSDDEIHVEANRSGYYSGGSYRYRDFFDDAFSEIVFEGGLTYDYQEIGRRVFERPPAGSHQTGAEIVGSDADDVILDSAETVLIDPRKGDDFVILESSLSYEDQTHTVVFAAGDGNDTVAPQNGRQYYRIRLADYLSTDVSLMSLASKTEFFLGDYPSLIADGYLKIGGSGDGLKLVGADEYLVEIEFADGEIWDQSRISNEMQLSENTIDPQQSGPWPTLLSQNGVVTPDGRVFLQRHGFGDQTIVFDGIDAEQVSVVERRGRFLIDIASEVDDEILITTVDMTTVVDSGYFAFIFGSDHISRDDVIQSIETGLTLPSPIASIEEYGSISLSRGVDSGLFYVYEDWDWTAPSVSLSGVTSSEISVEPNIDDHGFYLTIAPQATNLSDGMVIWVDGSLDPWDDRAVTVHLDDGTVLGLTELLEMINDVDAGRVVENHLSLIRGDDTGLFVFERFDGYYQFDPETGEYFRDTSPMQITLTGVTRQELSFKNGPSGVEIHVAARAADGSDALVIVGPGINLEPNDERLFSIIVDDGEISAADLAALPELQPVVRWIEGDIVLERGADNGVYRIDPYDVTSLTLSGVTANQIRVHETKTQSGFLITCPSSDNLRHMAV